MVPMKKLLKALLASMEEQGATVRRTSNGFQIMCPAGGIVTIHGTPSDHRALRNVRADVRRAGMEWPFD